MPADAYVMDSDMKMVADAIRRKTGKDAKLVFPDDFVAEIDKFESKPTIYGVRIHQSEPDPYKRVEYTDDAVGFTPMTRHNPGSWAGNPLIADIKPVLREPGGTWKDLNKRDLFKTTTGSPTPRAVGNDFFTEVRPWWLSESRIGDDVYIKLANRKVNGSYMKLASMYNGVDVGCFHMGCVHGYESGGKIYSTDGRAPTGNRSSDTYAQYCKARGAGFSRSMYYQWEYLRALFTILFKCTNGHTAIGHGINTAPGNTEYLTRSFDNDYGMAGDENDGAVPMSFFWIHNWWGNKYEYVGGAITASDRRLMTLMNGEPDDSPMSAYVTHATTLSPAERGLLKADCANTAIGFFPMQGEAPDKQYYCSDSYNKPSSVCRVGGVGAFGGPYNNVFYHQHNQAYSIIGVRLSYRAGRPGVEPI